MSDDRNAMNGPHRRCLSAVLVLLTAMILVAGLWPFRFHPPNLVHQQQDVGLVFGKNGIAYARDINWAAPGSSGFTLELWVRPAATAKQFATIACIVGSTDCSDFQIAQWESDVLLWPMLRETNGAPVRKKSGASVLAPGRWTYVVVSSGSGGTRFYINGALQQQYPERLAIENSHGMVVLGNNASGVEPWQGAVSGLAIYARPMTGNEARQRFEAWNRNDVPPAPVDSTAWFDFVSTHPTPTSPQMLVPSSFVPPHRTVLKWDPKFDHGGISDIVLNFVGFIPFGFLVFSLISERKSVTSAMVLSIAAGVAVSAAIELTQVYMPGRDSSAVDLLFNSVGTAAGAVMGWLFVRSAFYTRFVAICGEQKIGNSSE